MSEQADALISFTREIDSGNHKKPNRQKYKYTDFNCTRASQNYTDQPYTHKCTARFVDLNQSDFSRNVVIVFYD